MSIESDKNDDVKARAILRSDFLTMLDELELALRQTPKDGYTSRCCEISVSDACEAGSESVVQWNIEHADIEMLREGLKHPSSGDAVEEAARRYVGIYEGWLRCDEQAGALQSAFAELRAAVGGKPSELLEVVATAYRNIESLMCAYPDRFPQHAFEGTRDILRDALEGKEPVSATLPPIPPINDDLLGRIVYWASQKSKPWDTGHETTLMQFASVLSRLYVHEKGTG